MSSNVLYWDEFKNYLEVFKNSANNTLVNYKIDLSHFFTFTEGRLSTNLNTFKLFTEYLIKDKGDSRATICRRLSTLKSYYNFLYDEKYINVDISPKIKYIKLDPPKQKEIMLQKSLFSLMDAIDDIRDRSMMETLYSTGIREEELSNLNIQDIDFENELVAIVKAKRNKTRIVPISTDAMKWIKAYIGVRKEGPIFLNNRATRITPRSIYNICKKHFDVPPHDLRHSFATHLLVNGAPLKAVSEMLGHANEKITESQYAHVKSHHLSQVYKKVGGMNR